MSTPLLVETFTKADRCDRCGAQATARMHFQAGDLLFCTHHAREVRAVLPPLVGLDGESPVIGYTDDERHLPVVAWHWPHPGVELPVVILRCFICRLMVPAADLADTDVVHVSRVNGDSANGYEAYHAACCG